MKGTGKVELSCALAGNGKRGLYRTLGDFRDPGQPGNLFAGLDRADMAEEGRSREQIGVGQALLERPKVARHQTDLVNADARTGESGIGQRGDERRKDRKRVAEGKRVSVRVESG